MTTTTAETKLLRDAATPGEWKCGTGYYQDRPGNYAIGPVIANDDEDDDDFCARKDAKFIDHAVNKILAVCEERDALTISLEIAIKNGDAYMRDRNKKQSDLILMRIERDTLKSELADLKQELTDLYESTQGHV